jgi:Flp pilus assembly protein TadB
MTEPDGYADELKERPLSELLGTLAIDLSELAHEEIELAKAELTQKAKRAAVGGGMFTGAVVAAIMMLGTLTACIVAALSLGMPVWAAALIVAIVWGIAAAVLGSKGKRNLERANPPIPEQAIESTKEDIRWASSQMRSGRT